MELFGTFYLGAALLLLLASLPALETLNIKPFGDWAPKRGPWRATLWDLLRSELGAITTTYYVRGGTTLINGSTTAPTAAQASQVQKQAAVIIFSVVGDAQATFTHNWGLDASAPTYREPEILYDFISTAVATYEPLITFDRSNTNAVLVNKSSVYNPGDACTIVVTLRRPHSSGQ
jgi:hypothetical protein